MAIAAALLPLPAAATYVVTNTGDDGGIDPAPLAGTGTLRQAIVNANANCAATPAPIINFALTGTGPFQINLAAPLPPFQCATNAFSPTIDGTTQAGWVPNTADPGYNGVVQVIVDATAVASSSCLIQAYSGSYGGSVLSVKGLVIQNHDVFPFATAICGYNMDVRGNQIRGNGIGISGYDDVQVGGAAIADRNIVSGNIQTGIQVGYAGSVYISGNYIGTDPTGATAVPNGVGILVQANSNTTISGNVIAGNTFDGIRMVDEFTATISGNKIGVGTAGALGNSGSGIYIDHGCCGTPSISISNNVIRNNGSSGVRVGYGGGVSITQNSITGNSPKNISLYGGPLPNDLLDVDIGANGWQNHPIVLSVAQNVPYGGSTTITFALDSTPSSNYALEFYTNAALGLPAGESFVFQTTRSTDAYGGVMGGSITIPALLNNVSMLARDIATNDTSEFSPIQSIPLIPGVSVSTTTLNFGNVPLGVTSPGQTADFTSNGTAPWMTGSIASPTCYGGPAYYGGPICYGGPFSCFSSCTASASYSAGSGCNISGQFSPTVLGPQSVQVQVCDNATGSPRTITLTGNGVPALVPGVSVSSTTIAFGNVPVGATSPAGTTTFTSTGTGPWIVGPIASPTCYGGPIYYGGPICYGGAFTCSSSCSGATPYSSGTSCNLTANFLPTALGPQSVQVQVCDNAAGSPRTITLTGSGVPPPVPGVSVSSTSINFGNVPTGTTTGPQTVMFTSSGTAPWVIGAKGSPTCYGGPICSGGPFTCNTTCNTATPYNSGQTCQLDATYSPLAPGLHTVNVQFCDNATGSPRTIAISGNGIIPGTPAVSASATTLSFGQVPIGTTSATLSATFTSSGTLPWQITSQGSPTCYGGPICYGGEFTCATTCVPGSPYNPGQFCKVDAFFSPTAVGPQSVSVQFCDNAPGSPRTLVLSADAVPPPAITITPSAHDFGPRPVGTSSQPFTFGVSNPGTAAVFLGQPVVTPPFSLVSSTCPPTLVPSAPCNAIVSFGPTSEGYVAGSIRFAGFPDLGATLVGQGLTSAQLLLPASVDFPAYTLGEPPLTREIRLRNSGQLPLTIASLSVSAPFTLAHNCPATPIAPDASCTATLGFSATSTGAFEGSFTVVSNAAGGTQIIPVRANSQPRPRPLLSVTPSEIGFGGRGVFTLSPAQEVRIRNIGGAPAVFDSLVTTADFLILGHNCTTLAPLAECSANVAMQAISFGLRIGTLTIRSNAEGSPVTVLLSGSGCRPPGASGGRLSRSGSC